MTNSTMFGGTTGTAALNGPVEMLSDTEFGTLGNNGVLALNGVISGDHNISIGPGNVKFAAANAFNTPISVDGGALRITREAALGTSSGNPSDGTVVRQGGALEFFDSAVNLTDEFVQLDHGTIRARSGSTGSRIETNVELVTGTNVQLAPSSIPSISEDTTVNVLDMGFQVVLDLNGHTLELDSGGLLMRQSAGPKIINGRLTAGSDSNGEIFATLLHTSEIRADIVDNGLMSVSLTYTGEHGSQLELSGDNTYSGMTTVNRSTLRFATESAWPVGGDMVITDGARLHVNFLTGTPLRVGRLELLGGEVDVRDFDTGNALIEHDSILITHGTFSASLIGDGELVKTSDQFARLNGVNDAYTGQIVIEKGGLEVVHDTALGGGVPTEANGTIVRTDGHLAINSRLTRIEEYIVLNGGMVVIEDDRIEIDGFLDVRAPSEIRARDTSTVHSPLIGNGDLQLRGPSNGRAQRFNSLDLAGSLNGFGGNLSIVDGTVGLGGDNDLYSGQISIGLAELMVEHPNALGTGVTKIEIGGLLNVQTNDLRGNIDLAGGQITTGGGSRRAVLAALEVTDDSLVGSGELNGEIDLVFDGDTTIRRGVDLRVFADGLVTIGGRLTAEDDAAIRGTKGRLAIMGTVLGDGPDSVLRIYGSDWLDFGGTIQIPDGQRFEILVDGGTRGLVIDGGAIAGNGTLVGDYTLVHGAKISPGESVGRITIDGDVRLAVRENIAQPRAGLYEVELQSVLGPAGIGYDTIVVDGALDIATDSNDPLIVRLLGLDANGAPGVVADFDPNGTYRWVIASAGELTGFNSAAFEVDVSAFVAAHGPVPDDRYFYVIRTGNRLQLEYVPEPATSLLICAGLLLLQQRPSRRRLRHWRSCEVAV